MSGGAETKPYLRLVTTEGQVSRSDDSDSARVRRPATQQMLFSEASLQTLGFVKASQIDAALFIKLIEQASPKYIFDLRSAPNFGRGGLTRRSAFALFDEYNSRYFDVAGAVGAKGADDAILNPNILVPALQKKLLQSTKPLAGPVLFFVEEEQFVERYFDLIAANLPSLDDRGWEIAVWPSNSSADVSVQERRLVFISHANPQDNEIALWLSSRLTAEGYEVWSDITRLTGGELFWDTIEDVIRNQAAKVLVLLSKDSQNKPGVLDEVNVAIATERSRGLQRFVIPIRIDDLPFSEIRANLARKNVIDGQNNLANALNQVLEELQQSNVNKIVNIPIISMLRWQSENSKNEIQTREDWDLLIENRIRIEKWPKSIKKFKIPNSDAAQDYRAIPFPFPAHPCADGFLTFASWEEIKREKKQIVRGGEVVTNTFLETSGSDFLIGREADANRALVSLVRQGWDALCSNTGLKRFDLAGTFHCWFFENGFERGNTVRFVDHLGASRRKSLVGKSETRGVYWHFGIEARPSVRDGSIRLKAHVIFSEDGKTPISSPARQHILRRGFCRNWWNDRWRDLLAAALQHLSGGRESIRLPVSANDPLTVSASMVVYRAKRTSGDFKESGRNGHRLLFVEEPKLAVGYKQFTDDPREGLLLFGPVSFKRNPSNIRIGVIGTSEGLELFQNWCANFNKPIKEDTSSGRTVPFPGFQAAFGARWPNHPTYSRPISKTDLINAIRLKDRHQAVFKTVGLFTEEIRKAVKDNDVDVDIWFVVIPDEIYLYGRPASRVPSAISIATPNALGRKVAKRFRRETPSLFPEDNVEAKIYDHHVDFHNQLKARLLELGAITQILRESSIVGANAPATSFTDSSDDQSANTAAEGSNQTAVTRRMQDPATVAWNLSTAAFFKSGGRPWQVANARDGVCYIGLIYKRDPTGETRHSCCGAQMFLHDGEGLVFKGAMGPWYSQDKKQFHLSRKEAKRLIGEVMEAYDQLHRIPPKEIFIHGRTRFEREEWQGFLEAISSETKLVGVRITRSNDYKLYSAGDLPVRRGTALKISGDVGFLWTSGYVDRLGTYQGRETPNPLRVEICAGEHADLSTVMNDIMTLTKMNFNSCVYADGLPVTMRFADAIGDVLVSVKDLEVPPLPFRHYI